MINNNEVDKTDEEDIVVPKPRDSFFTDVLFQITPKSKTKNNRFFQLFLKTSPIIVELSLGAAVTSFLINKEINHFIVKK